LVAVTDLMALRHYLFFIGIIAKNRLTITAQWL